MKLPTILLAIVGGGAALLAWSQTWFDLVLVTGAGAGAGAVIAVTGQVASPAVAALGLAALALGGALAIAGRGIRVVLGVLAALLGGCVLLATGITLGDPVAAVGPAVTDATGVAGSAPTAELVAGSTATFWPAVAIVGGVLIVAAGVLALATGLAWPESSRRYGDGRRPRFEATGETAASGEASASPSPSEPAAPAAPAGPTSDQNAAQRRPREASDRAIDDWDELSRGDDPTD